MYRLSLAVFLLTSNCLIAYGLANNNQSGRRQSSKEPLKAVAKIEGAGGVQGLITFECNPATHQTVVTGQISGLTPGHHGFHIHQFGDLSEGCKSMGGHFNPAKHTHGSPQDNTRHVGDLGNIEANAAGVATINLSDPLIALSGPNSILGRGVVVHAMVDDLGRGATDESKKTGNAGARVGCGVVALAKTQA